MKTTGFLCAAMGLVAVNAQLNSPFPSDMPTCGEWCATNVTNSAGKYGCSNAQDTSCLCKNVTFGYAIHDCSHQYCLNDTAANIAIKWANDACAKMNEPINLPSADVPVAGASGTGGSGGSGGSSIPITTSTFTSVVTSGSSTFTTTGATIIFSAAPSTGAGAGSATGGASSPISTSTFTSVMMSGSSTFTTTGTTTIFGAGAENSTSSTGSATANGASPTSNGGAGSTSGGSATAASGSASGSAAASSTSSGHAAGAKQTAAPAAALFVAAGLAAALI